ncbi:hypothetical protein PGB90_003160 [Kerria lacca]
MADMVENMGKIITNETMLELRMEEIRRIDFKIVDDLFRNSIDTGLTVFYVKPMVWKFSTDLSDQLGFRHNEMEAIQSNSIFEGIIFQPFLWIMNILWNVGIIYIMRKITYFSFLYLWLYDVLREAFMIFFLPEILNQYFTERYDLHDAKLKNEIEKLTKKVQFPLRQVYIADDRTAWSPEEIIITGFAFKKIIIPSVLLEKFPEEDRLNNNEIVAAIAEKIAHWSLYYNLKNFLFYVVTLFFPFVFVRLLFYRNLTYQIFGFVFDKPVIIGLDIILVYILLPYNVIVSYWYNLFSRNWLFDADAYAPSLLPPSLILKLKTSGKAWFTRRLLITNAYGGIRKKSKNVFIENEVFDYGTIFTISFFKL